MDDARLNDGSFYGTVQTSQAQIDPAGRSVFCVTGFVRIVEARDGLGWRESKEWNR